MKTRTIINKDIFNEKTPAIQKADTLDFIREAISNSRSVVNDITRNKHMPESMPISKRTKKDSISVYYDGI